MTPSTAQPYLKSTTGIRSKMALAIVALCMCFLPLHSAWAGIITTYSDKASFLSDTGAVSLSGTIPNSGNVGTSVVLGDATFSMPDGEVIFLGELSTLIPGLELAISGIENLDVTLNDATPRFSFGFDFHEPTTGGGGLDVCGLPACLDSTFTATFYSDGALIDSVMFNALDDSLVFLGWSLDMGFDAVAIREIIGSGDNEYFGEFYASTVVVPEPSTLLLLAIGLLGIGGCRAPRFRTDAR